jgi:hypothetical protein
MDFFGFLDMGIPSSFLDVEGAFDAPAATAAQQTPKN